MGRRSVSAGSAVVALALVLAGAAPAVASAGWTVTPGGTATGTAGQILLTVRPVIGGPDQVWTCESSQVDLEIVPDGPWSLHALSAAAPLVSGEVRDVSATITGLNRLATVEGHLPIIYDNDSHELSTIPEFTLVFTHVDPVDDCLGIFNTGDRMSLDGVHGISPDQEIVPA